MKGWDPSDSELLCYTRGVRVRCTSALQHMDYFGAVSGARCQSQCLGMSLWAALGCAISPLATAEWSLLWDTALGLKTLWGLGGSPQPWNLGFLQNLSLITCEWMGLPIAKPAGPCWDQ